MPKQPVVLTKNGKIISGVAWSDYSAEEMNNSLNPPSKNQRNRFCNALASFFSCSDEPKQEDPQAKQPARPKTPPVAQNEYSLFNHPASCPDSLNDRLNNDEVKQSNTSAYI